MSGSFCISGHNGIVQIVMGWVGSVLEFGIVV